MTLRTMCSRRTDGQTTTGSRDAAQSGDSSKTRFRAAYEADCGAGLSIFTATEAEHPAPTRLLFCPECRHLESFDMLGYVPVDPESYWTCTCCGRVHSADLDLCPFCGEARDGGWAPSPGRIPAATWEVIR
jgi:hypothetical protein